MKWNERCHHHVAAGSRSAEPWPTLLPAVDDAVDARDLAGLRAAVDRVVEQSRAEHQDEEVPL